MNEYIFYTTEGITLAPNKNEEVENCQVLGIVEAKNVSKAKDLLLQKNPWITKSDFTMDKIMVKQVLTIEQKKDIQTIVEYNWSDEERDYQECGDNPRNHIFRAISVKTIKEVILTSSNGDFDISSR